MTWKILPALIVSLLVSILATPSLAFDCSSGPYIIFFPPNDAALEEEARFVIDEARRNVGACGSYRIHLSGHTDTSEAPMLSLSRSHAVRAYLMASGVPKGDIRIKAFGSASPRKVTGPNVSERQNRRVELTFGPSRLRAR